MTLRPRIISNTEMVLLESFPIIQRLFLIFAHMFSIQLRSENWAGYSTSSLFSIKQCLVILLSCLVWLLRIKNHLKDVLSSVCGNNTFHVLLLILYVVNFQIITIPLPLHANSKTFCIAIFKHFHYKNCTGDAK